MRPKRAKIRENTSLVRHPKSGAVLNTNKEEIARFQRERALENRLNKLEKDYNSLLEILKENGILGDHK